MGRFCTSIACLSIAFTLVAADPKTEIRLTKASPESAAAIEVHGLNAATLAKLRYADFAPREWNSLLHIVVAEGSAKDIAARPPVAGSYRVVDGVIRFEPLFSLTPGVKYRATFDPSKLPDGNLKADTITANLLLPKPPPGPPATIANVYPSANRLPENTLRFYVHFSGPMKRGDIYRHFKLLREDGTEVTRPFLELDEELWSLDGKRITILFHPGRVKRGLVPREEEGPILEAAKRYTFVVSGEWEDASGQPLGTEFRKSFIAGPPDDDVVDPMHWKLMPPKAGSTAPLIIRLAKPLDHALLDSMVWVSDAKGERVPGVITVGGGERVVTFAPTQPWAKGDFELVVDTRLEDVCGNRVGRPFEVDVFEPIQRRIETKTVERRFIVK